MRGARRSTSARRRRPRSPGRRGQRPGRRRTSGPAPCSTSRSQASASTPAVPQQRPLLSQKPGPQPLRQAGAGDGVPAAVGQRRPGRVAEHRTEQPEDLGVAGRAVAPAVAVALDAVRLVLRVGVRDQEARRAGLVAGHHVRGAGRRELDQVGAARRPADGGQRVARCPACRARCGEAGPACRPATSQCTPPAVGSAVRRYGVTASSASSTSPVASAPSAIPALPPSSSNWSAPAGPVEAGAHAGPGRGPRPRRRPRRPAARGRRAARRPSRSARSTAS